MHLELAALWMLQTYNEMEPDENNFYLKAFLYIIIGSRFSKQGDEGWLEINNEWVPKFNNPEDWTKTQSFDSWNAAGKEMGTGPAIANGSGSGNDEHVSVDDGDSSEEE